MRCRCHNADTRANANEAEATTAAAAAGMDSVDSLLQCPVPHTASSEVAGSNQRAFKINTFHVAALVATVTVTVTVTIIKPVRSA